MASRFGGARFFVRVLLGDGLGATGSSFVRSGEADVPARRSRSSKRRFSFLPVAWFFVRILLQSGRLLLTIVTLSDAVLNPPPLCQIRNLSPVFIWVGVRTESTAVAMTSTSASPAIISWMHGGGR